MRQCLGLVLFVSCIAFAGPTKKKKPPPPVASVEVKKALDERQAEVGNCVVNAEEPNTKWTQVVKVKLVLNSAGQVFSLELGIAPGNAKADATKACIDKALRAGTWPKLPSPLVTAEREWTFAMQ
ncbi:MAG: hypothetical protein QM817_38825 [Archangium sp.]